MSAAEHPMTDLERPMSAMDAGTITERNKAVVRGYLEAIVNVCDFSLWNRFFGERIVFNGRELTRETFPAVATAFRRFLPDLRVTVEDQIAEGDKVATRVTFRGTHDAEAAGIVPTGRRVAFRGFALDRLEGGRVVELWHEADVHGLMRQLRAE